jgi:ABC-2 type transport system permease protein
LGEKFTFAVLLQIALTLIVGITGILIFKAPLLHGISLLIGMLLSTFILSLHFFARDYRLLLTNWTSITQLFARGAGTLGQVLLLMGTMLIGVIIVVLYALASTIFLPLWSHFLVVAVIFGAGGVYLVWNWKRFWDQLES